MRFIDVDALRDCWRISESCESCHWKHIDCSKPPYYSLLDICNTIDEIPTVDAIPVEWLKKKLEQLRQKEYGGLGVAAITKVLMYWHEEQEAHDEIN